MNLAARNNCKVLIAAGGTGGHVFPALAVCEALNAKNVSVIWVGTAVGLESRVVPDAGIPMHLIDVIGWRGKNLLHRLKAPFLMLAAVFSVVAMLRREKITVVLGLGGFVSAAAGFAAIVSRKPLLLQEQNAVMGTANRCLSPFAKRIFTGFSSITSAGSKRVFTGNPLRSSFISKTNELNRLPPSSEQQLKILVVGGSLGARPLNELLPQSIAEFASSLGEGWSLQVLHQSGAAESEIVSSRYEKIVGSMPQVEVTVCPFIDDMASEMSCAHLMIARSGALSVSEALSMGLPTIFVPLPHAIDDHQTANAKEPVASGAAALLPQSEINAKILAAAISDCVLNSKTWTAMSREAFSLAKTDAAEVIANACLEYTNA